MTSRDHFDDVAAGVASLAPGDPERIAASEHARECARCADALRQAEQVMALIDAAPPQAPSPETLARLARNVTAAVEGPRTLGAPVLGAIVASWGIAVLLAKTRAHQTDLWVASATVLVLALGIAAVAALSRRAQGLAIVAAIGASILVAAATGTTGGLALAHGVKCTTIELVAATVPYGVLLYAVLRRHRTSSAWSFAALTAAGALAGQAGLLLTCPERTHTPHLLVTHTGGVLLAAILGWLGHGFAMKAATR